MKGPPDKNILTRRWGYKQMRCLVRCDFDFFGRVTNQELNQRVALEKSVRELPTSIFDMPSSRRYEAKREKMLPRATPEKIHQGTSTTSQWLIWRRQG